MPPSDNLPTTDPPVPPNDNRPPFLDGVGGPGRLYVVPAAFFRLSVCSRLLMLSSRPSPPLYKLSFHSHVTKSQKQKRDRENIHECTSKLRTRNDIYKSQINYTPPTAIYEIYLWSNLLIPRHILVLHQVTTVVLLTITYMLQVLLPIPLIAVLHRVRAA